MIKRTMTLLCVGSVLASFALLTASAQTTPTPATPATPTQPQTTPGASGLGVPGQRGLGARNMVPLTGSSQIPIDQAPAEVQRILRDQAAGGTIQSVTKGQWNGQNVYQISVQQNGRTRVVQVADNGTILNGPNGGNRRPLPGQGQRGTASNLVPLTGTTVIAIGQAPAEVQRILHDQAGAATIQSVSKGQWNGQNVYQAMIVQNGATRQVQVAENGTILNQPFGAQRPGMRGAEAGMVPITGGTAIDLSQVPAEVQRILRDQAQGGTIVKVIKGDWNGQPVYQAEISANGAARQVQVEGNGTILNGPNGALAREFRGRNLVPLTGASVINMTQAPAEVQRILRDQAQGGTIQSVTKGQWNGQNVYQATIDQDGRSRQVQVEENGTLLNGPRGRTR